MGPIGIVGPRLDPGRPMDLTRKLPAVPVEGEPPIIRQWRARVLEKPVAIALANSWAVHRHQFGAHEQLAREIALARLRDLGVPGDDAERLLDDRQRARHARVGEP
jgi:hypothetical protein